MGDNFGLSIASAGDGDGYSDVIIGAPLEQQVVPQEGMAFVYYGSRTGLSNQPAWSARGGQRGGQFGIRSAFGGKGAPRLVRCRRPAVRTIIDGDRAPGPSSLRWDGRGAAGRPVASGVYLVRLQQGARTAVAKLVVGR